MTTRKILACLTSLVAAVAMVACDSDSTTPTAPSASAELVNPPLGATAVDPGLPPGSVSVKATAPSPLSPPDGDDVGVGSAVLTVTNPAPVYSVQWTFDVRFEIFENANPSAVVHSASVPEGNGTTSYRVPNGVLQADTFYVWRARAESEGEGGPWSDIFSFTAIPFSIAPPLPLQPVGGIVTTSLRPSFTVKNGEVTGEVGTVLIEVEVALDALFTDVSAVGRTIARSRGETIVPIAQNLMEETIYFWRARGTNEDLPVTALLPPNAGSASTLPPIQGADEVVSEWSSTATFATPTAAAAGVFGGAGSSPNAPFTTGGGNPQNMVSVVQAVAAANPGALANSCQEHGGTWEFMDRVVEALRAIDGRWGYNCKRGNCNDISLDVVDYYRGSAPDTAAANGSSDVAIIDIIAGHCGPTPSPTWGDVTQFTKDAGAIGRFKYPR